MHYIDRIERLGACDDALAWLRAARHPDLPAAWSACPRADWLLWLAGRCAEPGSAEHQAVVAAAADCAGAALDLVPAGRAREAAAHAIDAGRRWARGEAAAEECSAAALAADAAAALAAAVFAAAHAANAAAAAGSAALAALYADAADVAGRTIDLAGIVRRHLPAPPTLPE